MAKVASILIRKQGPGSEQTKLGTAPFGDYDEQKKLLKVDTVEWVPRGAPLPHDVVSIKATRSDGSLLLYDMTVVGVGETGEGAVFRGT